MTKFLSSDSILELHGDILESPMRVNRALLESAAAAPLWYDSLEEQAAALLRSLTKNHPFVDGNKRTAILATMTFLHLNGYQLAASPTAIYNFVLRVTVTPNPDINWTADWLQSHLTEVGERDYE